ncbi:hypothetical protein NMY22_g17978 [Coprinellus aureogranulatus]|nr:hypothetical protein NMY22_g17978 [Coprinellus aureogranulatus]
MVLKFLTVGGERHGDILGELAHSNQLVAMCPPLPLTIEFEEGVDNPDDPALKVAMRSLRNLETGRPLVPFVNDKSPDTVLIHRRLPSLAHALMYIIAGGNTKLQAYELNEWAVESQKKQAMAKFPAVGRAAFTDPASTSADEAEPGDEGDSSDDEPRMVGPAPNRSATRTVNASHSTPTPSSTFVKMEPFSPSPGTVRAKNALIAYRAKASSRTPVSPQTPTTSKNTSTLTSPTGPIFHQAEFIPTNVFTQLESANSLYTTVRTPTGPSVVGTSRYSIEHVFLTDTERLEYLQHHDPVARDRLPHQTQLYLRCHGWSSPGLIGVIQACRRSSTLPDTFVAILTDEGMPMTEAFYLFSQNFWNMSGVLRKAASARKATRKKVRRRFKSSYRKTKAELKATGEKNLDSRKTINRALRAEGRYVKERAKTLAAETDLHTASWWERKILQTGKRSTRSRQLDRWKAYVSMRVKELNDELHAKGESRKKIFEHAPAISKEWKAMTPQQQKDATDDYIEEFEAERDEATESVQNVGIKGFHDVRTTIEQIEADVLALHARSKIDLADAALKMEAFMVTGIQGVADDHIKNIIELKAKTVSLISTKPGEAAGYPVKMSYVDFPARITINHRVILKGWPIKKFANPSNLGPRSDVLLVYEAFKNGTTCFERLNDTNYAKFCAEYDAAQNATSNPSTDDNDDDWEDVPTTTPSPQQPSASTGTSTPVPVNNSISPADDSSPAGDESPSAQPPTTTPTLPLHTPQAPLQHSSDIELPRKRHKKNGPQEIVFAAGSVLSSNGELIHVQKPARKPRMVGVAPR